MANSAALRLFVAIELPEEVCRALGALQDDIRRRGVGGLRWVRPEGIHLTLKFLGDTPAGRVPAINEALAPAARSTPVHRVAIDGTGTFGGRTPRVVWVDLKGETDELMALQARVDDALGKAGFPRESRPFSPHLTLARVRPEEARAIAEPLAAALRATTTPRAAIDVREVSLMRSELRPGGAVYTRLETFPLAGVE